MLSLFNRNSDICTSKLYDETTFYKAFTKDLKRTKHRVIIESPFLTVNRSTQLGPILGRLVDNGVKVTINTRHPDYHDSAHMQVQAWKSLALLKSYGVKTYMCHDLRHRKLAVIDDDVLWEGSLNILSHSNSIEIMRRTESASQVKQIIKFTEMDSI